ncbi:NifB/NifX family molybdenum-iron cluster-binding protein [Winogradskyella wichelsiae]|uniref:NifB/NifX family molybdenum-iron cluster-binding protein n=1 Tax=Winogradskyella wichelsiae TaxID=2697007 RepID=UPI0015C95D03|nr:NifB/NifX family molybdenum-iron cluster-binding protein [Winogradskyella wichelsiae]
MKKIAIPITKNNKVQNYFRDSKVYEIYIFSKANDILDVQLFDLNKNTDCSNIVNALVKEQVTFMLSDHIGNKALNKLNKAGITVIRGCAGDSADVVLQFVANEITDNGISCYGYRRKQHHLQN